MGHGTEAESNEIYAKLQNVLTEEGYKNYFIGTVEAEPTLEDVLNQVKEGGYKKSSSGTFDGCRRRSRKQ